MMGRCRRIVIGALAMGLLLVGGAARADESRARARTLIKSGDTNYRLAKFRAALDDYSAALKLRNHPAIVFNIAQCHRQLADHKKAVFYYKLYLSDWERKKPGTKPPYEAEVNGHIAHMTRILEQQKAAEARRRRERRGAKERARLATAHKPAPTEMPPPASQPGADSAPPAPQKSKLWLVAGITTAAAAAGMLGLGIAHDVKSTGKTHGSQEWAEAANMGLTGYLLAGGFAVASGVCWFLYARSGRAAPAAALAPLPGGAVVTGVFSF